jgi:hypothetical protein
VSTEDIAKGQRWSDALHEQLAKVKVTVVCITPDNVRSPWLYYEAGFIAAKLAVAAVCPYLIGIPGKLVTGTPLGLYQWTQADKTDTLKLVLSLHKLLGSPHDAGTLEGNFQAKWPQLKRKLEMVAEQFAEVEDEVTRTERPLSQQLTEEAKQLLIAACISGSDRATILYVRTLGGVYIQAGGKNMPNSSDARSVAIWKGALDELRGLSLIESLGHKGEVFQVTRKGWEVFDQIKPSEGSP